MFLYFLFSFLSVGMSSLVLALGMVVWPKEEYRSTTPRDSKKGRETPGPENTERPPRPAIKYTSTLFQAPGAIHLVTVEAMTCLRR